MNKLSQYILLLIIITSCHNSFDGKANNALQGNWIKEYYPEETMIDEDLPPPDFFFKPNVLYTFQNDTLFDANQFHNYNKKTKKNNYLGYKTKFIIKDSIIYWYNTLTKQDIEYGKIKKFTNDTIYFENFMLVKEKAQQVYQNKFDAIIVTSSGCYGTCPIYNYRIEADGTFIYDGEKFTNIEGLYKGKINKEYFNYFKKILNQIDIKNLPNKYERLATDGNYEELVFVKDEKVIKKISFYLNDGPPKVKQLLDILRLMDYYLEDKKPYQSQNYFSIQNPLYFYKTENGEDFSNYQMFYLWTELMKHQTNPFKFTSKTIKINNFRPNYYWNSEHKYFNPKSLVSLETDHQRFQIKFKNEPIQYYDLGYNFLENNNYYTN
ncbi:DUF6438 domain-containing protein [Empedobacter sp. ULE_I140]